MQAVAEQDELLLQVQGKRDRENERAREREKRIERERERARERERTGERERDTERARERERERKRERESGREIALAERDEVLLQVQVLTHDKQAGEASFTDVLRLSRRANSTSVAEEAMAALEAQRQDNIWLSDERKVS